MSIVRRRKKIHGEWWALVLNEDTEKTEWITQEELDERERQEKEEQTK